MQTSGIVQNIFPSVKHPKWSCLYFWDADKKKSFFEPIRNDRLKILKIEKGNDIDEIIKRMYNPNDFQSNPKEIERLKRMKTISDAKLRSEFKDRAPKEIVDQEIKKNKDITNKLSLYTS